MCSGGRGVRLRWHGERRTRTDEGVSPLLCSSTASRAPVVVSSGRGGDFMLASATRPAARHATGPDRRPQGTIIIEMIMEHYFP